MAEANGYWTEQIHVIFKERCAARYPFYLESEDEAPVLEVAGLFNPVDGKLWAASTALKRLKDVIGEVTDWSTLSSFLPDGWQVDPKKRRSAIASSFTAMLELARRGELEIRQDKTFDPIYLRQRPTQ